MLNVLISLFNELDAHVYVTDIETDEILFSNRKVKEAFGLDNDSDSRVCWKVMQRGFTGRCPFCPVFQLEKDPSVPVIWEERNTATGRYYRKVDSVIEWVGGKKAHMQYATDITDILEAQNEVRSVRERLELALMSSQAGVWEIDFDRDLLKYDAVFGRLFGLDPQKSAATLDELIEHIEKTARGVSAEKAIEGLLEKDPYADDLPKDYHLVFRDGTERYLRNYGYTVRNENGRASRLVGMCMDMTAHVLLEKDLKAARESAENANRSKSQFLSNMSHEVRTPMNAIIGMTEILLDDEDLNEQQRLYLNDIKSSSTALLDIINDILDFSKIEAGKFQLARVDYNVRQLLDNLESMFTFSASAKNLSFTMEIPGELPVCLYGDDVRLRQALINVLGNAVKFTRTGGVTFVVTATDSDLCFEVRDTGMGIKPEDLPRLFKRFDQLDFQNNRNTGGTGLGLSITKSLIDLMDGSMRVESEYGKGATFYLRIPMVLGDESKLAAVESGFEQFDAFDADILLVDDNEVNLNVASGLLRLSGIVCDTALSGREAVARVAEKKYDIVFMDHVMPGMDGVEATAMLRQQHGANAPVIIALTANAMEGVREMLLNAKMDDYLSKPIDTVQLRQTLLKWLPADKVRRRPMGEPPPETRQGLSPLLRRIEAIDGVDVRLGLDRLNGGQEIYETSVGILARRLPDIVQRLTTFLENGDLKGFSIEVHGVKSSLNAIGASRMALDAEALEQKSKEGDARFCAEHAPGLTAALSVLHEELVVALAEDEPEPVYIAKGDTSVLLERIAMARHWLDVFEIDEALEILRSVSRYDYGAEINETLKDIGRRIEEFDYQQAMAIIDTL